MAPCRRARHRTQRFIAVRAAPQALRSGRVHCRARRTPCGVQPARDQRGPRHGRRTAVSWTFDPCASACRPAPRARVSGLEHQERFQDTGKVGGGDQC